MFWNVLTHLIICAPTADLNSFYHGADCSIPLGILPQKISGTPVKIAQVTQYLKCRLCSLKPAQKREIGGVA